ncbi:regulator [Microbaculum sp. FT89]|uniref:regulator n=1 Tax=Microbaculum sp. FT89 TaxID=3447298 RepID=UPI003F52DFAF
MSREPEIEETTVYIVVGRAFREDSQPDPVDDDDETGAIAINVLLTAADDEECLQKALQALAGQGFVRVELDRVGIIEGEPDDPTFASAYGNAIDGQVAVIAFHG